MGEVYFALIGDIIGSRSIESRAEIQRSLGDKLREINEREGGEEPCGRICHYSRR